MNACMYVCIYICRERERERKREREKRERESTSRETLDDPLEAASAQRLRPSIQEKSASQNASIHEKSASQNVSIYESRLVWLHPSMRGHQIKMRPSMKSQWMTPSKQPPRSDCVHPHEVSIQIPREHTMFKGYIPTSIAGCPVEAGYLMQWEKIGENHHPPQVNYLPLLLRLQFQGKIVVLETGVDSWLQVAGGSRACPERRRKWLHPGKLIRVSFSCSENNYTNVFCL